MERLTGLDAGFLYMETPTQHLHTMKVAVVDPSGAEGGYSFERVREVLSAHLDRLPAFRHRLVPVPLGLGHPVWIEDPDFDIGNHLHRVRVDAPGGQAELDRVVSDVAGRPLDRSRPLWELWVVEELESGHVGFVSKIHHCVADGVKAAEMLMQVLTPDAAAGVPEERTPAWEGEAVPHARRLVTAALRDGVRDLAALPGLLLRTLRGFGRVVRRRRSGHDAPPPPFATVSTPFNRSLVAERIFVSTTLSLPDVKAVKSALGATVNDVVLAVCAGALRRWLGQHGGVPSRPLIAGVPVSTRDEFKVGRANSVSNLFTALPVHVADPVERLAEASRMMAAAKEQHRALGPEILEDWSQLTPPAPFQAVTRAYSRLRLADRHRPPINLIVSNVPGPTSPLFVAGARLVGIWSMGPILENIGLNITVWSYLDQLNFGLVACPHTVPDLRELAAHLRDALEELRKAAC
ncbi:MAG TPA: wax ester/triacylglycerol synthase family O-acyltransferase [Acidimicrobiales bacterium]|nr:wax ester/triacylglycerol synthase family O-acyltransferase [Acidimicrobiales bacterium]